MSAVKPGQANGVKFEMFVFDALPFARNAIVIETARARKPAAMILDVRLDNIGGFQLVQQMRNTINQANKDLWEVPVMMTTSRMRGRDKQYAISIGVNYYEEKPLTQARVSEWINRALKSRSRIPTQ